MFRKSKIKIVTAIMSILVILWVGTLGVIYMSSYFEMIRQNDQVLHTHAEKYTLYEEKEEKPAQKKPPADGGPGAKPGINPDSPKFKLARIYTVALSYEGETLEIKNDAPLVYANEELVTLAKRIARESKSSGTHNNLTYLKADKGEYFIVAFMDNTVMNESVDTLIRYTVIFGCVALIPFLLLSMFLAKIIVDPLEESYKKQKQFISDAGHELKTPVSVVSANAELLSRELGDNQWLRNIQYENERMGILVSQLLELARTENVTPQMETVDLSRLVAGETLPFESVAFEKGLTLNTNITAGITTEGNSAQLKQLVSILLDNAVRHSHENTEVSLRLTKDQGSAKLSVINSGDEIPAEQRKQLFERFYRVDTTRNSNDKHYGLGLAIAKSIVNAHKGHIDVLCYNGLIEFRVIIPTLRS